MPVEPLDWIAIFGGAVIAFVLGMVWFSPAMFGKAWVRGSHNIKPPSSPPVAAMVILFCGLLVLAVAVEALSAVALNRTAGLVVLAAGLVVAGMDLFSQKDVPASVVDAAYVWACGAIMMGASAIL